MSHKSTTLSCLNRIPEPGSVHRKARGLAKAGPRDFRSESWRQDTRVRCRAHQERDVCVGRAISYTSHAGRRSRRRNYSWSRARLAHTRSWRPPGTRVTSYTLVPARLARRNRTRRGRVPPRRGNTFGRCSPARLGLLRHPERRSPGPLRSTSQRRASCGRRPHFGWASASRRHRPQSTAARPDTRRRKQLASGEALSS